MNIPLSAPDIGELEIAYVTDVLRSGQLSLGPRLTQFEERFARYIGSRHAIACNSGTSALHMCVRALGIGPGDGVITTSFSFIASTNCLLYEGASPRFVDIDAHTLNIAPEAIREYLQEKCQRTSDGNVIDTLTRRQIKAILPVHVFGTPCDMKAIGNLAREYGLFVLEDACEGIGAEWENRRVGAFGDAGVFAFYPNKQMTTGEGGMVVTDDARIADLCRSLRNQGRDTDASWLKHVRLGYNYRLNDIQAALGLAQLERLDEILAARAEVARQYSDRLSGYKELILPALEVGTKRSWFVYVVRFAGPSPEALRSRVRAHLLSRGIASQVYFPAIHQQPFVRTLCADSLSPLPNTEEAANRCLAIPFSSRLKTSEIQFVCDELIHALSSDAGSHRAENVRPSAVAKNVVEARP